MTTIFNIAGPSDITVQEAELAFKLGLQLITEYKSILIRPDIDKELDAERREFETKLQSLTLNNDKTMADLKQFYESQLQQSEKRMHMLEQRYETRLQQTHEQHSKALSALGQQQHNHMQEKLNEIAAALKSKSLQETGTKGERQFADIANSVFRDFDKYSLDDKHNQTAMGDFHMHFKHFSVLVDSKNYSNQVPSTERAKIKRDLEANPHIEFAWLVSLYTSVDKFDKYPIMVEWANTKQCVVYINNLLSNPEWLLRTAWYMCDMLHKMNADHDGQNAENEVLKTRMHQAFENVREARKAVRELNSNINSQVKLVQSLDNRLQMTLNIESQALVETGQAQLDAWWSANVCAGPPQAVLVSSKLWTRYRQHLKQGGSNATEEDKEQFITYIKGKVGASELKFHGKTTNGAFDLHGLQWIQGQETINIQLTNNKNDI